jgi:hypothetical protein
MISRVIDWLIRRQFHDALVSQTSTARLNASLIGRFAATFTWHDDFADQLIAPSLVQSLKKSIRPPLSLWPNALSPPL